MASLRIPTMRLSSGSDVLSGGMRTITLPIGLPNHPSYPSAHSCITSAIMAVLANAFPSEKSRVDGIVEEAGMSRVYGGIHYRFDIEAGQNIGRAAAALALKGSLK